MMGEVKVFGVFTSPFSRRVEWALKHKGITYEYIEEDLKCKSNLLLKYNPIHKKVPVLLHNEKPIIESLVILEYIDEIWKENPLLPEDPYERAKARFWAKFADEKCPVIWAAFSSKDKEQQKAVESSLEVLKALDEELKGKMFFGGESVGMGDLVVGWIPHWLPVIEEVAGIKLLDAHTFPLLHSWAQNFVSIPFIKDNLPQRDKMLASFTNIRKSLLLK